MFSNQSSISLKSDSKTTNIDKKRLSDFKSKAAAVLEQLDIPISIYAATAKDQFRKPRAGMWTEFLRDHDLEAASDIDLEHCVFVGDAGGRAESSQGRRKDFSCSDRQAECISNAVRAKPMTFPGTSHPISACPTRRQRNFF